MAVVDYPSTYGDKNGGLIDWSGVTGVGICLECQHGLGPYFSLQETVSGLVAHRAEVHPDGVGDIAKRASQNVQCAGDPECKEPMYGRGFCRKHLQQARKRAEREAA